MVRVISCGEEIIRGEVEAEKSTYLRQNSRFNHKARQKEVGGFGEETCLRGGMNALQMFFLRNYL